MTRSSHKARLSAATARMVSEAAPVTITASADGGELSPPSFEAVAYSGGVVPGHTLTPRINGNYVIDLAGMGSARTMKANLDHKPAQRVGHLTEFDNDKTRIKVAGLLSAATPHRDEVAKSAASGYGWDVSIEASLVKPEKLAAGKKAIVNGREMTGPLTIFRKSTLTDLGFVSRGADEGNVVHVAASAAGEKNMNEFEKFAASLGVDLETVSDEHKANLQATFDAKAASSTPKTKGAIAALADEVRAENKRQDEIKAMGLRAMKEQPLYIDQIEKMVEAALSNDMDSDRFELELYRGTRVKAGTFHSRATGQHSDPLVIQAALAMAAGLPNVEKHYSEQVLDQVDRSGMKNNFSLQQLLLQVANANGYSCRAGERITAGNLRTVLEYCFPPAVARLGGFSTVSLPGILGNVANKEILAGYMEEDQTWKEVAQTKPVSNFYLQTSFRLLDSLEYEEVGASGEIKHGNLGQESYTRQAKTYGKMLGINRQQIINDDLGAFDDLRTRLGRGGAKKFNNVFWAAFMDNSSFFTSGNTNYISGSTTNLGVDGVGLEAGVTAFRKMTSPSADGTKRVGVAMGRPTIVVVPPELEFIALRLYQSTNVNTGGSATATSVPNANVHANMYRPVVQNRLSDSAFTGYSTTAWYLFGNDLKPIVVSFLNGNQTPTVESTDADFDTLGIQFRGYHDFGADKSEYLAGIKSKGAS